MSDDGVTVIDDFGEYTIWHEGNAPLVNILDDSGDGSMYLANDGTYRGIPGGIDTHNALNGRDAADGHPIAAITGLQGALDGKAPSSHNHDSVYVKLDGSNNMTSSLTTPGIEFISVTGAENGSTSTFTYRINADSYGGTGLFFAGRTADGQGYHNSNFYAFDGTTYKRCLTTADEGSGNGIDADMLDGKHATDFVAITGDTMSGNLVIRSSEPVLSLKETSDDTDLPVYWIEVMYDESFQIQKRATSDGSVLSTAINLEGGTSSIPSLSGLSSGWEIGGDKIWHEGNSHFQIKNDGTTDYFFIDIPLRVNGDISGFSSGNNQSIALGTHDVLSGREHPDQHPIEAISGLTDELDDISDSISTIETKINSSVKKDSFILKSGLISNNDVYGVSVPLFNETINIPEDYSNVAITFSATLEAEPDTPLEISLYLDGQSLFSSLYQIKWVGNQKGGKQVINLFAVDSIPAPGDYTLYFLVNKEEDVNTNWLNYSYKIEYN